MKEKKFICNWPGCEKAFVANCFLEKHMWVHTEPTDPAKKSYCDWPGCEKYFRDKQAVKRHMWVHVKDTVVEGRFVCDRPDCRKILRDKSSLAIHIQGHGRLEKIRRQKHICDWANCGKEFRVARDLKGHMEMHTEHNVPNRPHEEFRVIPGIPKYAVSNQGRVRTVRTNRVRSLRQGVDGYVTVSLHNGTCRRPLLVHRLVMLAFVGPVPLNKTVDHIDRNRANNALSNLRYASIQEQILNRSVRSTQRRNSTPVDRIDSTAVIVRYASALEAARSICCGKTPSAQLCHNVRQAAKKGAIYKGYAWRFGFDGIWKDIPPSAIGGQAGYAASADGKIKSPKAYITSGGSTASGYLIVTIGKHVYRVHRLIATAFLSPPSDKHNIVNHINGIRHDNRIENLEYVTPSGNTQHAIDTGLMKARKAVKKYTLAREFLGEFPSVLDAGNSIGERKSPLISMCCKGKRRSAYGFLWRFSNDPL